MPPVPSLEQSVTSYLSSRHCRPTPEWIRSQIPTAGNPENPEGEDRNPSPRSSFDPDQVYQRWIKLNWAEDGFQAHSLPALPSDFGMENINHQPRTLTGAYLVQVLQITNISKPRSKDADELEEEEDEDGDDDGEDFGKLFKKGAKGKKGPAKGNSKGKKGGPNKRATDRARFSRFGTRTLRLVLTDGHTQALAIEYMPIPTLTAEQHTNGTKLLLTGPFEVRAGTFFLRPANVKVVYMTPLVGPYGNYHRLWNGGGNHQNQNRNNNENNPPAQHNGNHNGNVVLNGDVGGGRHQNNNNHNGNNHHVEQNNYDALLEDDWDELDDLPL